MDNDQSKNQKIPKPDGVSERYPIEDDADTLEPLDDTTENRKINTADPHELVYWTAQFQISADELKSTIALTGDSVREVKKYLSI